MNPFLIIFSITLVLFSNIHYCSSETTSEKLDIVSETCKRCADGDPNVSFNLCNNSLSSVPKSHKSDLRGLALISLKLSIKNATHVKSQVKKLLKATPANDTYMRSCLESCEELYSDAISALRDSVKAIKAKRFDDAITYLSSVVDDPQTCEDGFSEGGIVSPLGKEDDNFFGLSAISLSMSSLLA
ncbi:Pectinesterase protein [Dioscorea alata]|uniref:Pectinesterase protein n=1 Tax=Dioscorea alata TaxID=55571 RepID=A0ACB7V5J4_DIOAL|nr:Pectinesterase protein [Dioscorea alata]